MTSKPRRQRTITPLHRSEKGGAVAYSEEWFSRSSTPFSNEEEVFDHLRNAAIEHLKPGDVFEIRRTLIEITRDSLGRETFGATFRQAVWYSHVYMKDLPLLETDVNRWMTSIGVFLVERNRIEEVTVH